MRRAARSSVDGTGAAAAPAWAIPGSANDGDLATTSGPALELEVDVRPTFETWYAESFDRLVRLAYLLVGSTDVARDLTQDAMVKVLRRWSTVEDPDRYAHRAVVNACNSHHRRRAVARRHPSPRAEPTDLGARELTDALDRLPPRQRAAVVLRYWGDLTEDDIAAALGVKRGTVASLLHRAHAELAQVIDR